MKVKKKIVSKETSPNTVKETIDSEVLISKPMEKKEEIDKLVNDSIEKEAKTDKS